MLREFETGQAVVEDADGTVLRQLEKPEKTKLGTMKFNHIITYQLKSDATKYAKIMGFPGNHVEKMVTRFGFEVYAVRWDWRYPYYIACWEV